MKYEISNIIIPFEIEQKNGIIEELKKLGIEGEYIKNIDYLKKSVDSRNRANIKFVYNILLDYNDKLTIKSQNIKEVEEERPVLRNIKKVKNVIIAGAGPAGLFAGLRLAQYGLKPIIFERGSDVDTRALDIADFRKNSILNEDSNVQYGEGGAGTFSDGKLTTRIRSEYIETIFKEFVEAGAKEEILYDFRPHIGTDVLVRVVKNIREKIISFGGKVLFNSKITDIKIENGKVVGVYVNNNDYYDAEHLIMATGHSARDTYKMLAKSGVFLENKDFAIGVRIEHPQEEINKMQYGSFYNHSSLPPAAYSFTYNNEDKRGVFSFCMCPGGEIINAASETGGTLVNGMSNSKRNGKFANSAIVVAIGEKDYGRNLFDGVLYQEKFEKNAFDIIGNYGALYQNLFDFKDGKVSKGTIESSYKMRLQSYDFNKFFPEVISKNMGKAFQYWSKNGHFISKKANLIGAETRTSSPVRVKRDERGVSINIANLYPVGEGAGYAGGIVSAAVDGIKCVDNNFTEEKI